jgi:transcriptional regulator with XRE-family HTH domain
MTRAMQGKKAPDPIDTHVGNKVHMRRIKMGWTQQKLGDALGLTFQQVQKYEKGTNRIGASRLQRISDILQVPIEYFFESAPHAKEMIKTKMPPSVTDLSEFVASPEGLALIKALMSIQQPRLRRRIIDLVEEIADYQIRRVAFEIKGS